MGALDQRDARTWIVLELTRAGEMKADEGVLEGLLREALGLDATWPVFVPAATYTSRGQQISVALMEGYAFVASGLTESVYFALEVSSPYVKKVLTTRMPTGMRVPSVIPDARVQEMKAQLSAHVSTDVFEGMRVQVTDGTYNHLEGVVILIDQDCAYVHIVMRSIDLITPIPRSYLAPLKEEGEP